MAATELRAVPRTLRRDTTIFAAAMAMETAHLLDDALIDPQSGTADIPDGTVALLMGIVAVAAFSRIPVWARAVLAGLFGLAGLVGGLDAHVAHALESGASGGDFSGFGHAAAGLVLLGLSATLALRRRV
jgi:hypothetical protein